jgi:hypothetical protein
MSNIKYKPKGVSLPLITGLVALLMVSSAAVNELIIRSMQSIQRIEASNMAYLAAEGGIEDALYELTPHFAGYQTANMRSSEFEGNKWRNEWGIVSRSGANEWSERIYKNQKVLVYLYDDNHVPGVTPTTNAINEDPILPLHINALNVSGDLDITFTIPDSLTSIISTGKPLIIDNDEDLWLNGVNEDRVSDTDPSCANPEDGDCDGFVDEDSDEDPVIMWKLTDGAEKNLIPIKGCLESSGVKGSGDEKSEICEKDFSPILIPGDAPEYSVRLDQNTIGRREDGELETINEFIARALGSGVNNVKLHFEFLIVAPMEHVEGGNKKYEIPYIEFTVNSNMTTQIPYPYFTINSDGYYRGFKQSITATISPKVTVPLFDFTIIQQE